MRLLLFVHLILLLLASTDFSIVTFVAGEPLHWQYLDYRSSSGFGRPYVSDYSFAVVATYLASYLCGTFAYLAARARGLRVVGSVGLLLCLIGVASFILEISHWIVDHHRSWIAHSPAVMIVLAVVCFFSRPGSHNPETQLTRAE